MRQGGEPLNEVELRAVMHKIEDTPQGGGLFSSGLQGIDSDNMAPYFDDALESLVQQYGLWTINYNVDMEYNRRDLRDVAIHRALWAVLVCQGYAPFGENGYGDWSTFTDDDHHKISGKRSEAWEVINTLDLPGITEIAE